MSGVESFKAALSVLSGRVDVCDLSYSARKSLGILFDPKTSIVARGEALECVENRIAQVILAGSGGEA